MRCGYNFALIFHQKKLFLAHPISDRHDARSFYLSHSSDWQSHFFAGKYELLDFAKYYAHGIVQANGEP